MFKKTLALLLGLAGIACAGPAGPPAGNYLLNVSTIAAKPAFNVSSGTVRDQLKLGYGTKGNLLYLDPTGIVTTTTTVPAGGDVFKASTQTFTAPNTFASSTTFNKQLRVATTGAGQGQGTGGSILVYATNETGMPFQIYSSSANQAGFFGLINLINSNTNYANAYLYVNGASSATGKASAYFTDPNPNIQFVQTGVVSPAGQYEFMVLGDTLQFRSMNAGGSAYKPRVGMTHPGALVLYETSDNGHYVALMASASIPSNVTWVMPAADGTAGQVLTTDGNKNFYFSTASGGGVGDMVNANNETVTGIKTMVSSFTVTSTITVNTVVFTGTGNAILTEPNGLSGQVIIATSAITTGHMLVAGSSVTAIDGGVPGTGGGSPTGPDYSVQVSSPSNVALEGFANLTNNGSTIAVTGVYTRTQTNLSTRTVANVYYDVSGSTLSTGIILANGSAGLQNWVLTSSGPGVSASFKISPASTIYISSHASTAGSWNFTVSGSTWTTIDCSTITPHGANDVIRLTVMSTYQAVTNAYYTFFRGSVNLVSETIGFGQFSNDANVSPLALVFLDNPNTTSQTIYCLKGLDNSGSTLTTGYLTSYMAAEDISQ